MCSVPETIDFARSDCEYLAMAIDFERGSEKYSVDHLKTEVLATRLIRIAARALSQNIKVEIIVWCKAATGVGHLLRVTKGLHQEEGPLRDLLHLTMRLYIPGSKQGDLVPDTHFAKKFHLYAKLLKPTSTQNSYQIQPTRLSYQTVDHKGKLDEGAVDEDFLYENIPTTRTLSTDFTSKS
jgi:hypothetical protein